MLQGIVLHVLERSDNFLRLKRVSFKYRKAAKEISQAGLDLVSVEPELNLAKPSRSEAWSRLQRGPAKPSATHTQLGLRRAGAPPRAPSPAHKLNLQPRVPRQRPRSRRRPAALPSAASAGQRRLRAKPARPPRSPSPSLCSGPAASGPAPHRSPGAAGAADPGLAQQPPAPALPPLRALRAAGPVTVGPRLAPQPRPPRRSPAHPRARRRPGSARAAARKPFPLG